MSETTADKLSFGLAREVPPTSPAAWGARCIYSECTQGSLRFVYNRQSAAGTDEDRTRLQKALDRGLPEAGRVFKSLVDRYLVDQKSSEVFTLYQDSEVTIVASPNGSYGYLYVVAWIS